MEAEKNKPQIKIFSTINGINIIKSPIKAQILSLLKEGGLSGSKIVALTGKSKSTISAHLQDLFNSGIIDWMVDPEDRRRKIFFINAKFLGDLSSEKEIEEDMDQYLKKYISDSNDPFEFFRFMFRTIRVSLLDEGINIDPILHDAGIKVGKTVYNKVESADIENLTKNLADFWENNRLGRVEFESIKPLIIQAYDCFECEDLPQIGRPACAFDSGILEAVFSSYFHDPVKVQETKCYAKGDHFCRFLVKPQNEF
jgi:predicted hydrocarbon binding protein